MVVIDKLPFESPKEPLVAAKINAIRQAGGDAFSDYQIPQATISLKQGAGRLLRSENDCGIIAVGDPRLYARQYGETFLRSLGEMKKTRSQKSVLKFIFDKIVVSA